MYYLIIIGLITLVAATAIAFCDGFDITWNTIAMFFLTVLMCVLLFGTILMLMTSLTLAEIPACAKVETTIYKAIPLADQHYIPEDLPLDCYIIDTITQDNEHTYTIFTDNDEVLQLTDCTFVYDGTDGVLAETVKTSVNPKYCPAITSKTETTVHLGSANSIYTVYDYTSIAP